MNNKKRNIIFIVRIARLIFYIAFFAFFIITPTKTFLENSVCIFRNLTGLNCPTCGVTRAFSCIMHLNFKEAFHFNPIFTIMICPICVSFFLQDAFIIIRDLIKRKETYSLIEYIFVM